VKVFGKVSDIVYEKAVKPNHPDVTKEAFESDKVEVIVKEKKSLTGSFKKLGNSLKPTKSTKSTKSDKEIKKETKTDKTYLTPSTSAKDLKASKKGNSIKLLGNPLKTKVNKASKATEEKKSLVDKGLEKLAKTNAPNTLVGEGAKNALDKRSKTIREKGLEALSKGKDKSTANAAKAVLINERTNYFIKRKSAFKKKHFQNNYS